MIRNLFLLTFWSAIAFSVVSFLSVMASLLSSAGNLKAKPVCNLGFPYRYYYQFWLPGSDSPNCGWNESYFAYDCIIAFAATALVYFVIQKIRKRSVQRLSS